MKKVSSIFFYRDLFKYTLESILMDFLGSPIHKFLDLKKKFNLCII